MPVYLDKKTNRLFIQFQFKGQTFKRRLPVGATKDKAKQLEVKLKNDLFFDQTKQREKPECLWEDFICEVYLVHIEANQSAEALTRAIAICKASIPRGLKVKPARVMTFITLRCASNEIDSDSQTVYDRRGRVLFTDTFGLTNSTNRVAPGTFYKNIFDKFCAMLPPR